jgi:hypothetical protein
MTAAEDFLRGLQTAGGWPNGTPQEPEPATDREPAACTHPTCTCTPEEASS